MEIKALRLLSHKLKKFFLINTELTIADFLNQQCAQNTSLTNSQYESKRSAIIWNIKEGDQIKFDYMKKTMKGFTFVDCYDYITFFPSQFDWITEERIEAKNKDTKKSFIIKKKVRGVLDIEYKGEKKLIVEDAQVSQSEDSHIDTVDFKQNRKVSKKANK